MIVAICEVNEYYKVELGLRIEQTILMERTFNDIEELRSTYRIALTRFNEFEILEDGKKFPTMWGGKIRHSIYISTLGNWNKKSDKEKDIVYKGLCYSVTPKYRVLKYTHPDIVKPLELDTYNSSSNFKHGYKL